MGGSANIQGIKAQTLACLLEALNTENDWQSFVLEPNFGNSKVDIEWHYENKITLVQIKSSQNRFTKKQVEKLAEEIENENPQCSSVILTLVGNNFPGLKDSLRISAKTTIKLLTLSFDDLRAVCSNKLDVYFDKKRISTSPVKREIFVGALIDRLEECAITSKSITREEFTLWLDILLEIRDSSFLKQENEEIEAFQKLFSFKETNKHRRRAILNYYPSSSLRNIHLVIKDASEFLAYDENGNLNVEIGLVQYFVYTAFLLAEVGFFILGTALGVLEGTFPPSKSSFLIAAATLTIFIMSIPLALVTNPFIQALRIRYELRKKLF